MEAEDVAWVAAMVLIPEENVNLIDTVAVTDRKYFFSTNIALKYNIFICPCSVENICVFMLFICYDTG